MSSLRYLNSILTVLAILLALQLWTTWAGTPVATAVQAQTRTTPAPAAANGIPDAAGQRKEMIDLLKRQTQQLEELGTLLRSGQVRVKVEAAPNKDN